MYSFAFCHFIEEKKKTIKKKKKKQKKKKKTKQKTKQNKKKKQKNKHTKELHRPGIEPGTSRSPVLHFITALMHTLRN